MVKYGSGKVVKKNAGQVAAQKKNSSGQATSAGSKGAGKSTGEGQAFVATRSSKKTRR